MAFIIEGDDLPGGSESEDFANEFLQSYRQGVQISASERADRRQGKRVERGLKLGEDRFAEDKAENARRRTLEDEDRYMMRQDRERAQRERGAAQESIAASTQGLKKRYGALLDVDVPVDDPSTLVDESDVDITGDPELADYFAQEAERLQQMDPRDAAARVESLGKELEMIEDQKLREKLQEQLDFIDGVGGLGNGQEEDPNAVDENGAPPKGSNAELKALTSALIAKGDIREAIKLINDHQVAQAKKDQDTESLAAFLAEATSALTVPGPASLLITPESRAEATLIRNLAQRKGFRGETLERATRDFYSTLYRLRPTTRTGAGGKASLKDAHSMASSDLEAGMITPEQFDQRVESYMARAEGRQPPGENLQIPKPKPGNAFASMPKGSKKAAMDALVANGIEGGSATLGEIGEQFGFDPSTLTAEEKQEILDAIKKGQKDPSALEPWQVEQIKAREKGSPRTMRRRERGPTPKKGALEPRFTGER